MINFEKVSKFILSDISINIPKGEIVGLIGASGSGKTTFVRLACGLLTPDLGRVRVLGKNPVDYRQKYFSDVSTFIVGKNLLDKETSVIQNFEMLRIMYGINKSEFYKRYNEISEMLDFKGYEYEKVISLSFGQKMRVEVAAALILEPMLLLLDEPTVGMDQNAKECLTKILKEKASEGMTILITSHDMQSISNICTRLAIIDKGTLIYYGSKERLRRKYLPKNKMTITFEGEMPNIDDLPINRYTIDNDKITYEYNDNYISSSEVVEVILDQTEIRDINIEKSELESIVMQIIGGQNEFYRSE
ncbi:MAG: ATP-binding cassette domain-containing protein [Lachnospiraceae bacterium]|nr:ATP-binding cassette domain-containing protein [Lachnospiraceae bacterium]